MDFDERLNQIPPQAAAMKRKSLSEPLRGNKKQRLNFESVQSSCSSNKISVDESGSADSVVDERFKWTSGSLLSFELLLEEKVRFNVVPDWRDVFEAFKQECSNATTRILVAKLMKMQLRDTELYKRINSTSNQTEILECLVNEESLNKQLVKNAKKEKDAIEESVKALARKRLRKSAKYSRQTLISSSQAYINAPSGHKNMSENTSMPSVNPAKKSKADCVKDAKSFGNMSEVALFHTMRFFDKEDNCEIYMNMTVQEKEGLIKEFHSPNPRCF